MRARILEDTGGDRPPLVYVPGVDGTGEFLFGTAARLAQHFRLIRLAYDHADTRPTDGYGELAASVAEALTAAGLERVLLLAESFGVGLALRTTLDHPGRVSGLALVNGFARYDRRGLIALGVWMADHAPSRLFELGRGRAVVYGLFRPRRDAGVERAFLDMPNRTFDEGYRRRLHLIAGLDLRERLREITQPVALFASDKDRIVNSVQAATAMHTELADATLEVLHGAGHVVLPFAEEPWVERMRALAARTAVS